MASAPLGVVIGHIRKLAGSPRAERATDGQLLQRFATERDGDAFDELMRRHGPLVLGVCRRVLRHEQDAEDAFQAAFLVLARKAGAIQKAGSVGSYLYGVAYRIAMKERTRLLNRRTRERHAEAKAPDGPAYEAAWRELQVVLDEGLNRLPEKYRTPFVLCCLEGRTKAEAARELGWKEGTVASRLAQARQRLQRLLARKGVTLSAALIAVGVAGRVSAAIPRVLLESSTRLAIPFARRASSALLTTSEAARLADSMLQSMSAPCWKAATVLLLVVGLAVGGAGLSHQAEAAKLATEKESSSAAKVSAGSAAEQPKPRTDRYGDPLPSGALARLGTIRFRQGFFTRAALFSPDGKTIACAGAGRGLCLWDAATGKELRQIGRAAHAASISFSPDGKVLACAFDANGGTALYEVATGRNILDLPQGIGARPNTLIYSPDGKTIAGSVGAGGSDIHFFDAATGEKREQELSSGQDSIYRLTWSPDSQRLAWVGEKGLIHLWDAKKSEEVAVWKGHEKPTHGVAFSPDGKTLATGGLDDTIRLWDVATHKELRVLDGAHQYVRMVIFSHDGRLLASGHGDGTLALWDGVSGKEIRRWRAHAFTTSSLDFAPDDKALVSGAVWECGPLLWDVATGTEVQHFAGHQAPVDHLYFADNGRRIVTLGRDKRILEWDPASGRENERLRWPPELAHGALDKLALSPRGDVAASWGYYDDKVRLWDMATGKERRILGTFGNRNKESFLEAMTFSPDGQQLAFAGINDGSVSVWDVAAGVERRKLEGLSKKVLSVTFSPDGEKIAAGSYSVQGGGKIAVWDVSNGKTLLRLSSRGRVDRLAFSPDGKMLASCAMMDAGPLLWDVATGRELRPLAGVPPLYDVAFSPDGKWLAGAGADKDQKVHVWETMTGLEVRSFSGHLGGGIMSVAFAPDGRTLASGGGDSSVLLWDLTGRMREGHLRPVKWTQPELEQRWRDLSSSDGPRALQALWDLVSSPEQAVSLLRDRVKPVQPADPRRVEQLLRDLDSEDFDTRSKATTELEKIAEGAEPALRMRLAERPALETRQRILQALEAANSYDRIRMLRAVQILEYVATSEAKQLLGEFTKGLPEARLTREAKAALERVAATRNGARD
jgi:RNA polymerase sigma factor (sigma-70 family)